MRDLIATGCGNHFDNLLQLLIVLQGHDLVMQLLQFSQVFGWQWSIVAATTAQRLIQLLCRRMPTIVNVVNYCRTTVIVYVIAWRRSNVIGSR